MRISLRTSLLLLSLVSLVCIVAVQNTRNAKRIERLEAELETRELELAQFVITQSAKALYSEEELSEDEQMVQQQYQFADVVLQLWYYGDLIVKHGTKLGNNGLIYDEDPAVRARQLIGKFNFKREYLESFVDSRIERLLAISEPDLLRYLLEQVESEDYSGFDQMFFSDIENAQKFESVHDFAQRLESAIK